MKSFCNRFRLITTFHGLNLCLGMSVLFRVKIVIYPSKIRDFTMRMKEDS
jgi:hypothetical protein